MSGSVTDVGCHICGARQLKTVEGFEALYRVTSDCKPWARGGQLCVCPACGCVQKAINDKWLSEIEKIYGNYSIYYQSDGVEQAVFDGCSGQASLRSARLLEVLATRVELPEEGRMLDVGCGNGALLRAFSRFAPRWTLAGAELSDKTRKAVESIERVEALYVGALEQIPGTFDIVTMSHMLEHIPHPIEYFARLKDRLKPGGLLVIEVPNYLQNPFDLLVADHSSHFTARTSAQLIERAGYEVMWAATDWIPKELSIVARHAVSPVGEMKTEVEFDAFSVTAKMVQWLKEIVATTREYAMKGRFGIFGTSIAATWLFAEIGEWAEFFVDEDSSRVGKTFMGRKVYHPSEMPGKCVVFLALPREIAESVQRRLARPDVVFHLPPQLKVN